MCGVSHEDMRMKNEWAFERAIERESRRVWEKQKEGVYPNEKEGGGAKKRGE